MLRLPNGMNWYLIKMVYQIVTGDGQHTPQVDVQFRLITADDPDWALEKAQIIGRIGESSYVNENSEPVRWKFVAVEDVRRILRIDDGEEIYGEIIEPGDLREYVSMVNARANRLTDFNARERNASLRTGNPLPAG